MRVYCYWNLHKDCYSLMALEGPDKGRVIAYAESVELAAVSFTVSEAGRLKSITGNKRVHAGMRGQLVSTLPMPSTGMRAITYNPRKYESFVTRDTIEPVTNAKRAVGLTVNGRAQCFAQL